MCIRDSPGTAKGPLRGAGPSRRTTHLVVELRGFEPLTFSLRTRRATNCATAPQAEIRLAPGPTRLRNRRRPRAPRERRSLPRGPTTREDLVEVDRARA